jgi:hypothetical protein
MVGASLGAIRRFHETVKAHPDEAREVVAALFDKIVFTPVTTPNGPRYQLEGVAEIGRLLTLDSRAKWASPGGFELPIRGLKKDQSRRLLDRQAPDIPGKVRVPLVPPRSGLFRPEPWR